MSLRHKQIHDDENMSSECRLCVAHFDRSEMSQIFVHGIDSLLENRITSVIQIQICCGDGLPASVCKQCVETLNSASSLQAQFFATDALLRKVLAFFSDASNGDKNAPKLTGKPLKIFQAMHGNKEEVSTLCRSCATRHKPSEMSKIFTDSESSYENQIETLTHIKLRVGDGLPDAVCSVCVGKLSAACKFIAKSVASDLLLRNVFYEIKREPKIELDDSEDISFVENGIKRETNEPDPFELDELDKILAFPVRTTSPAAANDRSRGTDDGKIQSSPAAPASLVTRRLQVRLERLELKGLTGLGAAKPDLARASAEADESSVADSPSLSLRQRGKAPVPSESAANIRPSVSTFNCDVCKKEYRTKYGLVQHFRTHTGERPYSCSVCAKTFARSDKLSNHLQIHNPTFVCPVCEKQFYHNQRLVDHMRTHTGERPFSCSVCAKTYFGKSDLNKHAKKHTKTENICPALSTFSCDFCNRELKTKRGLVEHIRTHTGERPYSCTVCAKTFAGKSQLRRHSKIQNPTLACPVCDKKFSRNHYLVEHLRTHTGERPYSCSVCAKKFFQKSHLKKHTKIHTKTENIRPAVSTFSCDFCKKESRTKRALVEHIRTHTGERPYSCSVCAKTFTSTNGLRKHAAIHTESRTTFVCADCGKTLSSKQNLGEHMRLHTGERPYACNVCDKTFVIKSSLTVHARIHTKSMPTFKCLVCGKTLCSKQRLEEHMRLHSEERQYT